MKKLRFGMIGGGPGAFIGAVHRLAAQMDGQAELVAGAFSSDPKKSRQAGAELGLDPARVYPSFQNMAAAEAKRTGPDRLDFVIVVTPNHLHFAPTKAFLEKGFHVVCDKPLAFNVQEAEALRKIVARTGRLLVVTYNYTANAMVKEARTLVRSGRLGTIRKVVVDYTQGWLWSDLESTGQKQASWRVDPRRSGAGGALGDIGTHAENLVRYVTGLEVEAVCAETSRFVKGRKLDDDANVLLRLSGGARGVLQVSQIAIGEDNNLRLRVYGSKGSLEWHQEHPEELTVAFPNAPKEVRRRAHGYVSDDAKRVTRIPAGHPEGYLEAFGNLYRAAFAAMRKDKGKHDFPTVEDGLNGMRFVAAAVKSAAKGAVWVRLPRTGRR